MHHAAQLSFHCHFTLHVPIFPNSHRTANLPFAPRPFPRPLPHHYPRQMSAISAIHLASSYPVIQPDPKTVGNLVPPLVAVIGETA